MSEARAPSGANAERDALHAKLRAAYARTATAGVQLAKIVQRANTEADLVAHYGGVAYAILALEELKAIAEQAAKDLRAAMMISLSETGAPQIATADFTAYLAKEPAFLEILDPGKIPPDLWTTPKSEPDRKLVKAALEAGRNLGGGAAITTRNAQRLVIRGKSQ
jgi:hypothetical protein